MVSIEPGNREGPPGSLTEPKRDIVVIGASRGGVEALREIVAALPLNLRSTLLIVLHISPTHASFFPAILSRAGRLRAEHGRNGTRIERGRIYVAPPDHHMTVGPRLTHPLAWAQPQRGLDMLDREIGLAGPEPEYAAMEPAVGVAGVERERIHRHAVRPGAARQLDEDADPAERAV